MTGTSLNHLTCDLLWESHTQEHNESNLLRGQASSNYMHLTVFRLKLFSEVPLIPTSSPTC